MHEISSRACVDESIHKGTLDVNSGRDIDFDSSSKAIVIGERTGVISVALVHYVQVISRENGGDSTL